MATRYYPTVKPPNVIVHGGCEGTWAGKGARGSTFNPVKWNFELLTDKTLAGTQTAFTTATNQESNYDFFIQRWMTKPLDAQTISGTIDLCFGVQAYWSTLLGTSDDSVVRYKVHVYIAEGQTTTPRHVLLDNYLDGVDFPGIAGLVWHQLSSAQALTSGDTLDGDVIIVEIGARIVSSPTPTPTYVPSDATIITLNGRGANIAFVDAVNGDTGNKAPWIEFSDTITEQALPAPPANDACADAISIAVFPYTSAFIDCSQSADTDRAIWWKFTAPSTGRVILSAHGSNYGNGILTYTGGCGVLTPVAAVENAVSSYPHRSLSARVIDVTIGVEYWIKVYNVTSSFQSPDGGGSARLSLFYQETPEADDLYVPIGTLFALRDGQYTNLTNAFTSSIPTGIAIDYTERPMDSLNGGINTSHRILLGLHSYTLVEIIDLVTMNLGEFEIDYIGTPFSAGSLGHIATLYITADGFLHVGWFGNGYLFVAGLTSGGGNLPAILNTVSNDPDYSSLRSIDATHGDNQSGAPYTDTPRVLDIEITAPWAITLDEGNNILYYTSGGFYEPVGGEIIKKYNLTTDTQLADFATIPLQPGNNPGIKGLQFIPGSSGQVLVCNSTVVHRLNASGVIINTYTPSIALDSQFLVDVKVTADGTKFWVIDELTTRLFQFNISTGVELQTVQPYGAPEVIAEMAIYQPDIPAVGGIYKMVRDKRNDTIWVTFTPVGTEDVEIP